MASIHETHAGVARLTPHGQPRPLHPKTDDGAGTLSRRTTVCGPGSDPARSITRGEAEGSKSPGSKRPKARERQTPPAPAETTRRANRVFVMGADGIPLMPCTIQRARMLIDAGRVKKRDYRPFTIHLKDRARDDGRTAVVPMEIRCTPGSRKTGIAVVAKLESSDRVLYQEEIAHRTDITKRLEERKGHRRRRRGTKWYRKPRFNNRCRADGWLAPSLESSVSNQEHRMNRLTARSGATSAVIQSGRFDTHKILNPNVHGIGYQQGPLYRTHVREYIATQWKHRCAYCGKGDFEDATRFNIDHVKPRSAGGPDNIGNLVWSCRPCNQRKADHTVEDFLKNKPKRLEKVLGKRQAALAAAGQYAAVCKALIRRIRRTGLPITETTGADTAYARRLAGVEKSHANDAAFCGSNRRIETLRTAVKLKNVGHGRRKQIKGLPRTPYLRWQALKPEERRQTPCPGHARTPNHVHGVRTGDWVRVLGSTGWKKGTARVEASSGRIKIQTANRTLSTSKADCVVRIAPRNGYREPK